MDTHIQFSNINFFYFALLKTSPEAKLLIIQNLICMSTAKRNFSNFFKLEQKLTFAATFYFLRIGRECQVDSAKMHVLCWCMIKRSRKNGAGDEGRTRDFQLGKLTLYH